MPRKIYKVDLTDEERGELKALTTTGRAAARKLTHARILLMCDENRDGGTMIDKDVAAALNIGQSTVERVRRRFVEEGFEAALNRKRQVNRRAKVLDGEAEAQLIAVACGEPPTGRATWTLRLLADRLVELEVVPAVSTETVRRTLKKTNLSLG